MLEKNLLEKRFIATLIALLCSAGLVYADKLGAANFEQIVIWVTGLFVAGGASDTWAQFYNAAKLKTSSEKVQLNG